MLPRGIQAKISLILFGLLLVGMVLIDLVLLMVLKNQLFLFETQKAHHYLQQFQNKLAGTTLLQTTHALEIEPLLNILPLYDDKKCLGLTVNDHFFSAGSCNFEHIIKRYIRLAVKTGQKQQTMEGRSWAVFQRGAQFLLVTAPIRWQEEIVGGAGLMVPLAPLYSILRHSQKILGLYLLINLIILSIGGYYLISRMFLRPIKRLAARAEQYDEDGESLFSVRLEDGELNKLSLALNQMMDRISKDKEKLRENVAVLERTNLELTKAQKGVVRAEKLASVGRLSAGIAHEIGNPIGIILGYLELLKSEEPNRDEWQDYLLRAESEVQRINVIIKQLLNISRPVEGEPELLSLHLFLEELIQDVKIQPLLANIKIDFSAEARHDQVLVDPNHLRQVCLNLLINAADAIKSSNNAAKGHIRITTSDNSQPSQNNQAIPSMVAIRICDNGKGISEEALENIFDPFYTTKDPGKGTGLGLSVSLTIIEQMGGSLTAESFQGEGTTITITLPFSSQTS
jgi:two-component system, NtrC family, sensor kinase